MIFCHGCVLTLWAENQVKPDRNWFYPGDCVNKFSNAYKVRQNKGCPH